MDGVDNSCLLPETLTAGQHIYVYAVGPLKWTAATTVKDDLRGVFFYAGDDRIYCPNIFYGYGDNMFPYVSEQRKRWRRRSESDIDAFAYDCLAILVSGSLRPSASRENLLLTESLRQ